LLQQDSSATNWSVSYATPNYAGLQNNLVILHLGIPNSGTARTADNCYAALELADGSEANYRLVFAWGTPIRLDYTDASLGGFWKEGVAVARNLGDVEHYLREHNNQIVIGIRPDYSKGLLTIEIGDGNYLRNTVLRPFNSANPGKVGALPIIENYVFYGSNRYGGIEIHPLQFSPPTVSRGFRYFGNDRLSNLGNAEVSVLRLGSADSTQQAEPTFYTDGAGGLAYDVSVENLDSSVPQKISDVIIYIPPEWGTVVPVLPITGGVLHSVRCRELEVWDDSTRMGMYSARLLLNNKDSIYVGQFGNYAVDLSAGNGEIFAKRVTGIIGKDPDGIKLSRKDPFRFAELPIRDFFAKMEVPLSQEIVLDGLCIYAAVRLLAMIGNIHPKYLQTIPDVGLPPDGGYPDDFPYYILGSGTGNNPKYRYLPNATVLSVLCDLIRDSGEVDPYTGTSTPHYMWFDTDRQFHFQPFDPRQNYPVKFYSSYTPGTNSILELEVYNSVEQMRTEVILQGQDALTYELLQIALPLPGNLAAVGFRFSAFERSSSYATPAYLERIARTAAYQASLPTQVIRMKVPFDPTVHAGNNIIVAEERTLAQAGVFTVLEIDSTYGVLNPESTGQPVYNVCESWITARSIESGIPA